MDKEGSREGIKSVEIYWKVVVSSPSEILTGPKFVQDGCVKGMNWKDWRQ